MLSWKKKHIYERMSPNYLQLNTEKIEIKWSLPSFWSNISSPGFIMSERKKKNWLHFYPVALHWLDVSYKIDNKRLSAQTSSSKMRDLLSQHVPSSH